MWNTVVSKGRLSAFALFLSLSGCTALSDYKYEVDQKIRTHHAWGEFDGCHNQCFTCDYSSGWKAGYYDVATGGKGCPPVVAPQKYWKPPVFTQYDPSRRDDWYRGFQDGAAYANCQPDHHYIQAYLPPRTCCPVQSASYPSFVEEPSEFPLEEMHGDHNYLAPMLNSPHTESGSRATEDAPTPTAPPVGEAPSTEPAPAAPAAETYEKDPEPASTQTAPSANSTLQQRLVRQYQEQQVRQATAIRSSLLERLVSNASQDAP